MHYSYASLIHEMGCTEKISVVYLLVLWILKNFETNTFLDKINSLWDI